MALVDGAPEGAGLTVGPTLRDLAVKRIATQLLGEIADDKVRRYARVFVHILESFPGSYSEALLLLNAWVKPNALAAAKDVQVAWNDAVDTAVAGLLTFEPKAVDGSTPIYNTLTAAERDAVYARVALPLPAGVETKVQAIRTAWTAFRQVVG